uniref:Pentacotripeptide-repeat region of PRORP domain-containing protein n=1 Tax=Manihot esculenta TaxID=3983 RepID=A0A2C9V9P0_MANES
MAEKGVAPSVVTYNTLINGYEKLCTFDRCFQILEEMEEIGIYNMLIDGSCVVGKLKDALRFFDEMLRSEIGATLATCNALINGLCKKGRLMEAEDLLLQITSSGYSPDAVTYNSLISGYANAGNVPKCLELYETMKKLGIKQTINTFHPLISGCSRQGIELVETLFTKIHAEIGSLRKPYELYRDMIDRGFQTDKMTYHSLILGHLREGELSETKDLVDSMKAKGLAPNANTYNILVKGHCDRKDFGVAYIWCREMTENNFHPSEGRLNEVRVICSEMKVKGMADWGSIEDLSAVAET